MPIKDVSVHYYNWGPFVMKTKLPGDVINELKSKGRTAKIYWNKNLAGHLKKQIRYDQPDAEWFYEEVGPVFATYKELADKYHGCLVRLRIPEVSISPLSDRVECDFPDLICLMPKN